MSGLAGVIVEGHGEVKAIDNLLHRLHPGRWRAATRWPSLQTEAGRRKAAEAHRNRGLGALLLLRDDDDGCPKETGPRIAREMEALQLPFPVASVLLRPEYEVLFLPCLERMQGVRIDGRPGLKAGTRWDRPHWEARRDVKGWLSAHMDAGKSYKPSLDQLALTRLIDLEALRDADVPCFGTLERALGFLVDRWGEPGVVYPPPAER